MAFDVEVEFIQGDGVITYPKIDRVTEGPHALRLEVRKYPGVVGDKEMKHIASIPYASMLWWGEKHG